MNWCVEWRWAEFFDCYLSIATISYSFLYHSVAHFFSFAAEVTVFEGLPRRQTRRDPRPTWRSIASLQIYGFGNILRFYVNLIHEIVTQ